MSITSAVQAAEARASLEAFEEEQRQKARTEAEAATAALGALADAFGEEMMQTIAAARTEAMGLGASSSMTIVQYIDGMERFCRRLPELVAAERNRLETLRFEELTTTEEETPGA